MPGSTDTDHEDSDVMEIPPPETTPVLPAIAAVPAPDIDMQPASPLVHSGSEAEVEGATHGGDDREDISAHDNAEVQENDVVADDEEEDDEDDTDDEEEDSDEGEQAEDDAADATTVTSGPGPMTVKDEPHSSLLSPQSPNGGMNMAISMPMLPSLPELASGPPTPATASAPSRSRPGSRKGTPPFGASLTATTNATNGHTGGGIMQVDGEDDLKHSPHSKLSKGRLGHSSVPPTDAAVPPQSQATKTARPPASKAKKHHSPSPSPPPPIIRPPLRTIRLDIVLGGPDKYEVDVRKLATESGQRDPTPPPVVVIAPDTSESEADTKVKPLDEDITKTKKRKRKVKPTAEYYDVSDPFIDDSELALDSRSFFAQTKQTGFYVSSGEIALLKDSTGSSKVKPPASASGGGFPHPLSLVNPDGTLAIPGVPEPGEKGFKKPKKKLELHAHSTLIASLHQHTIVQARKASATAASNSNDAGGSADLPSRAVSDVDEEGLSSGQNHTGVEGDDAGMRKTSAQPTLHVFTQVPRSAAGESPEHPIAIGEDDEDGEGQKSAMPTSAVGRTRSESKAAAAAAAAAEDALGKRKRSEPASASMQPEEDLPSNKKRKVIVDIQSFHPELQESLEQLKIAISKENWSNKGKFPPDLKPLLSSLAMQAIKLGDYNEDFFSLMPSLFPYNRFTMTKLIKRTVFPEYLAFLNAEVDKLLQKLEEEAKDGFSKAESEWEHSVSLWDQKKSKSLNADGETTSATGTRQQTEEVMDVDGEDGVKTEKHDAGEMPSTQNPAGTANGGPPPKKYRMTDSMKQIVYQLVLLSNECCRLENEKHSLEKSGIQVSEQGLRKALYQRIVASFPDGWMSSGQISRDVSAMKKRYEREAVEDD